MSATVINGSEVAKASRRLTAERVRKFTSSEGWAPGLATVLVGSDPASEIYVRRKREAAAEAGFVDFHHHLDSAVTQTAIMNLLDELALDPGVSGILLQLPLPVHLSRFALINRIPVSKDVDGLTTLSQGLLARGHEGLRPCTAAGVIELLDSAGISLDGAEAVVVGRSDLVGHPSAELLLRRGATVTIAHSHTRKLSTITRRADVLIAAAGVRGLITAEYIKPGAAVIDVGIHRAEKGLTGDVLFDDVADVAGWITPVPGGVGPMTIAMLLSNTVTAAERAAGAPRA